MIFFDGGQCTAVSKGDSGFESGGFGKNGFYRQGFEQQSVCDAKGQDLSTQKFRLLLKKLSFGCDKVIHLQRSGWSERSYTISAGSYTGGH